MFTPEIARKASFLMDRQVENDLKLIFNDLLTQASNRVKANSTDAELRAYAIKKELLENLINYRQHLEDAVNYGIASTRNK